MANTTIDSLKNRLRSNFCILGTSKGNAQNVVEICKWRSTGSIDYSGYHELRAFNQKLYREQLLANVKGGQQ